MSAFLAILKRDLRLALRGGAAIGTALGFYLVVVAILPLGLGPDLKLLSRIATGLLWIALLLAALLSSDRIFQTDYDDGSLAVMALGPLPMEAVVAAKCLAHWITTGIPLTLMTPALGLMLNLEPDAYPIIVLTMLVGTPAISFIGAIGAALTLTSGRGGLLLALLILPFYIPVLIFGISCVSAVTTGPGSFAAPFLILLAITLASLVLAPVAAAAALRLQMQ